MAASSLSKLLDQKAELERQIAEVQKQERSDAIQQVRQLMAQHGLTVADIASRAAGAKAAGPKAPGKVAVKYRDKATGDTWSGRGLKPKWLQAAMASGRSLADFTV